MWIKRNGVLRVRALGLLVALGASCVPTEKPVSVGSGTNEMKPSPCRHSDERDSAAWWRPGAKVALTVRPCPKLKLFELNSEAGPAGPQGGRRGQG